MLSAVRELAALASRADATPAALWEVGRRVIDEANTDVDRNAALTALRPAIEQAGDVASGVTATICGALIEHGGNPHLVAEAILRRTDVILAKSGRLCDAVRAVIGEPEDHAGDNEPADHGNSHEHEHNEDCDHHDDAIADRIEREQRGDFDDDEEEDDEFAEYEARFQQALPDVKQSHPRDSDGLDAIEQIWRPTILVLSLSAAARARCRPWRQTAERSAPFHVGAHWIATMTRVLDDEPLLAIEPATRKGFEIRLGGVVDNFQLHMLLMDALIGDPAQGWLAGARPAEEICQVARGDGPQSLEGGVAGQWNMYTWEAIDDRLELPAPDDYATDCWIWGEGSPADIPVFLGKRVVLLGPPSYERSWAAQRIFDRLAARFDIVQKLTKSECEQALRKMAELSA